MKLRYTLIAFVGMVVLALLHLNTAAATTATVKSHAPLGGTVRFMPRFFAADASAPTLSDDGRYILYEYYFFGERGYFPTLRYYDTQTGTLTDLFNAPDAQPYGTGAMPRLSPDGRFSTFVGCYLGLSGGTDSACPHAYRHDHTTGETLLASVNPIGDPANQPSSYPSLTADGSKVVFASEADNLVPNDANGASDIFIRDFDAGTTTRIAVTIDGAEPNGDSYQPTITDNGAFIVFESEASNWVPMDTNATCINGALNMTCRDVFIYEVATGLVERVSVTTEGIEGNGASFGASISGDCDTIVFTSSSNNLVAGDTNGNAESCYTPQSGANYCYDVFLHERSTGETRRISLNNDGSQLNGSSYDGVLSPDGEFAVFLSLALGINQNSSLYPTMLRLNLKTHQWEALGTTLGESRIDVTSMAQQVGYSTYSVAYRTCDVNSYLCHEAAVWDATNRPYVVPLPACSGYPRPDTPASASSRGGAYSVYLPMTRNSCRAGHP